MSPAASAPQPGPAIRHGLLFFAVASVVIAANAVIVGIYPRFAGGAPPEWPLIFDFLVLLPLLYFVFNRHRGKSAVLGALAMAGLGTFAGSLILPAESKQAWQVIEDFRQVAIVFLLAVQFAWILSLLVRVVRASPTENPEQVLDLSIGERFGSGMLAGALRLEGRVWMYALLRHPVRRAFPGSRHFHVCRQGMNASNQAAFLVLVGAEIPVAHLLVHLFDPFIALVVTALSLYGFLFMLAEYRATLHRPLSVTSRGLHVRYGVASDFIVEWSAIAAIRPSPGGTRRATGRLRLKGMGETNIAIDLEAGTRVQSLLGPRVVREIHLGVDEPQALIEEVRRHIPQT
jgi:hypothetical protein